MSLIFCDETPIWSNGACVPSMKTPKRMTECLGHKSSGGGTKFRRVPVHFNHSLWPHVTILNLYEPVFKICIDWRSFLYFSNNLKSHRNISWNFRSLHKKDKCKWLKSGLSPPSIFFRASCNLNSVKSK